jgi:hypothetical protein
MEVTADLLLAASIPDAASILRRAAIQYREDAAEMAAAWQDDRAGAVWLKLADDLDRAADRATKAWEKL